MKKLLIVLLLLASLLIAWGLGERQPAWGQSPIVSPVVYLPMVLNNWDGTPAPTPTMPPTPTPVPLPTFQGVGHDRKWEQNEADWLCPALDLSGVSWYYDWTPYPIQCPGIEAVPMIWDETQISVPAQGNSEWLAVFNEPEFQSQAGLAPQEAVAYYREVEQLYPDKKLIGPGVVHLWWLEDFWAAYVQAYGEPPRMDALAIHSYPQIVGDAPTSTLIQRSINDIQAAIDFAAAHDIPEVWVTEFAVQPRGDPQKPIAYVTAMIAWFQAQSTVTRRAWFGLDLTGFWYLPDRPDYSALYDTSLVLSGELTPLGEVY